MSKELIIREEKRGDYDAIEKVIIEAFKSLEISDKSEHLLVKRLRDSNLHIPQLCLIAECKDEILGHVFLSKIHVKTQKVELDFLALAPISVLPHHQRKGIGEKLIKEVHQIAKTLEYSGIILIGHEDYYPKFGYELLSNYNIEMPFEAPIKNQMIYPLNELRLEKIKKGTVVYPKEFFG